MIAMDDVRVNFNGVDLYDTFGLMNCSVGGEQQIHIFAGNKTLSTVSPMYRSSQINAGISGEPLSFTLTFALKETEEWNDDLVDAVYRTLDVDTYKPLRFGDEDIYYNCIPFVGSVSEMKLFAHNGGYFTVSFQCDAPHCWRNAEYNFDRRNAEEASHRWHMMNLSNIKGYNEDCRTYPYIIVDHLGEQADGTQKTPPEGQGWNISFGLDALIESTNPQEGDKGWFNLWNVPSYVERIEIDCYNQQIYGYYTENDVEKNVNLIKCMKIYGGDFDDPKRPYSIYFFYLLGGKNIVRHRSVQDHDQDGQSDYQIHFYLTMPYMK